MFQAHLGEKRKERKKQMHPCLGKSGSSNLWFKVKRWQDRSHGGRRFWESSLASLLPLQRKPAGNWFHHYFKF